MPRRTRRSRPRICRNPGCDREIQRWMRLCRPCFARLPFNSRRAMAQALAARDQVLVARLAAEGAAWLAENSPARLADARIEAREAAE